jgi:hypothetical protein
MEQAIAIGRMTGRAWRRVVIVAALVSFLVAGGISLVYGAIVDRPGPAPESEGVSETRDVGSLSRVGDSCRQAALIPKAGWVCQDH